MEKENSIQFNLSQNAKNHIIRITSSLPELKTWFEERIESAKMEMDVLNKTTDFGGYINVIMYVITDYIYDSNFDYGDGVSLFSDQLVLNMYNKNEIDYDKLCILTFLGYAEATSAQEIIKEIDSDLCNDPVKFEDTTIPYKVHLWKNEKITDFSMIKTIINFWVNMLITEKINLFDYTNVIEEIDVKEKFTSLAKDYLFIANT